MITGSPVTVNLFRRQDSDGLDAALLVWYHFNENVKKFEIEIILDNVKKILIQCDFDGTVTKDDISFILLDAFAKGDWRMINKQYADGKINVGEFNEKAFALVNAGKKTMLDYLKDKVKIRRGFKSFVELCRKKGIRLVIVSNGLDFYIKNILKDMGSPDLEYHAAETSFHADKLKVRYIGPDGSIVDSGYKNKYVNYYLNQGYQVIYIGNGTSDLSPARDCHQIFATESLLENCQRHGVSCIPFTSFLEINKILASR
jgi:2-hydroxy-3-keto-5-methylthiopentenyl-1-phosphate phosphatase